MRSRIRSISTRALVACVITAATATAAADPLNTSFESPVVTGYTPATTPTAWNGIPYGQYFNPWLDRNDPDYGTPPDGDQFGGPYSGVFWQNTGILLEQDVKYTVTFWAKAYHGYSGNVEGQIWATTDQVSRGVFKAGISETHPGTAAAWMQYTMTYTCDSSTAGRWLVISVGDPTAAWTAYDAFHVALNVPISNGSFETPVVTGYTTGSAPQAWNGLAYSGYFTPWVDTNTSEYGQAKDGTQYAGPYAGAFWQNTGIKMVNTFKYTLSFWAKAAHPYTNNIEAAIYAAPNATDLGSQRAYLQATKTGGSSADWTLYTVSYTCDLANDGKFLVAYVGDPTGAWVAYDLVTVDAPQRNRYYWKEDKPGEPGAMATYVYMASATLNQGWTYVFETRNLSAGADTVMHLTQGTLTNEVAYNDDCPGGGLGSCISFTPSSTGTYYLIIYAYSPNSGGRGGHTFDLYVGGNLYSSGLHLGGYVVYTTQTSQESFETVLVNDGAPATALARLDWNAAAGHYKPAATDWTSGVGDASKLWGNGNSKWILATATPATREGPVRAIRNDALLNDADEDGLGDYLERELCTCSGLDVWACGFACMGPGVEVSFRDTDGDGLPDYWEAIGCETNSSKAGMPLQALCPGAQGGLSHPQYLPAWGASPRHKDVFVEIDYLAGQSLLGYWDALSINDIYATLTNLTNPDGTPGVRAHLDVGQDCEARDATHDGVTDQCGDFAGTGPKINPTSCQDFGRSALQIAPYREGIFHFVQMGGVGTTDCGPCDWSCDVGGAFNVAHELGHQLGLSHGGASDAGNANCKPNYRSIMNYAYSSSFFSNGSLAAWPLNPRDLREAGAYPAGVNVQFLANDPYHYSLRTNASGGTDVDWNRDGDFDDSVRAQVCPPPDGVCAWGDPSADQPMLYARETLPGLDNHVTMGPGAAMHWDNQRTFVFVHYPNDHRFWYNVSYQVSGGWPSNNWSPLGDAVHGQNSQPAAVTFQSALGARIYVFGANDAGRVRYVFFDQNGLGTWSDPMENPAGVALDEVSVAARTNPSVLYIVGRDRATHNVWMNRMDALGNWLGWQQAFSNSDFTAIRSNTYTPGVAAAGDGNLYLVSNQFNAIPRPYLLRLWRYAGSGYWDPVDVGWGTNEVGWGYRVTGRPALLYRAHRKGDGTPLASGNGALWAYYQVFQPAHETTPDTWNVLYRWSWGKMSDATFSMGKFQDFWLMSITGMGVAVVDHPESLSLFAPGTPIGGSGGLNVLHHLPYADGQSRPTHLINDWDDATTIRTGLAASLAH